LTLHLTTMVSGIWQILQEKQKHYAKSRQ